MTQIELLKSTSSLLMLLKNNGMRVRDIDMLPIVLEAEEMTNNGKQRVQTIQYLAKKYNISVRSVYSGIERLNRDVKM